jgi:hypothetical protein
MERRVARPLTSKWLFYGQDSVFEASLRRSKRLGIVDVLRNEYFNGMIGCVTV